MSVSITDLPEEVLANIISFALPPEASIVRYGCVVAWLTPLFLASKQFSRTTQSVYYNRRLHVYVTQDEYVCQPRYSQSRARHQGRSVTLPWTRFRSIKLHIHPELSFLSIEHGMRHIDRVESERQRANNHFPHDDIPTAAKHVSRILQEAGLLTLAFDGKIRMVMEFYNECPFHGPGPYQDPDHPPFYHLPVWDFPKVLGIIREFSWILGTSASMSDFNKTIRFPHLAWMGHIKGDINGIYLGKDFISTPVWECCRTNREVATSPQFASDNSDARLSALSELNLKSWVDSFGGPVRHYTISPLGKLISLIPCDVDRARWEKCHSRLSQYLSCTRLADPWYSHELELLRQLFIWIEHGAHPRYLRWHNLIDEIRFRIFESILTASLDEMDKSGVKEASNRDEKAELARRACGPIEVHLRRFVEFGLWNGCWHALNCAEHHVGEQDGATDLYWCECGRRVLPEKG